MTTINQTNAKPGEGRVFKGKSLTQLAEYQPLGKMLANLTIAGLNASARQALEFYDNYVEEEIDIPLLPRHINPDITSVFEIGRQFAEQKQKIEDKVREEMEKKNQENIKRAEAYIKELKAKAGVSAEQKTG